MRHEIRHPVINDAGFNVWSQYAVRAWPTIVLVDPAGNYVGTQSGEIRAEDFIPVIEQMIADFDAQGRIDRRQLDLRPDAATEPVRPLSYPSRILPAPDGRLFIADTGHHRVLELRLDDTGSSGEIRRVFGSGEATRCDGAAEQAAFHSPHGLS